MGALRNVERVVSKNISLPILNTILLKTDNGQLKISATNLEIGTNCWIGAKVNEPGEIAVPAKIFSDFIGNVSDEKVTISTSKNVIIVNSEHYKTQILGMETKDFPIIPKLKKDHEFRIESKVLRSALLAVLDSASLSETRPELSGIYTNISENRAEFAATDGFRLSEKIVNLSTEVSKSFIIPRNTALEISRLVENLNAETSIAVSDNQIFVYGEDFELISRLIDGRFPEYKKVIPDNFMSLAKINKSDFEKNIRLASIFSSSISDIKLKFIKDKMEISAKNSDRGEIVSSVGCSLKNEPFEVSVNFHYLLDGLKIFPTDDILLEFTGELGPLVIKGENQKDQTYVIMPLRN